MTRHISEPDADGLDREEVVLMTTVPTPFHRGIPARDVQPLAHEPFCLLRTFLMTKLSTPRPRTQLVARPRLLQRLEQGRACKLTLLSAPAGFGKTTLLAQWLATQRTPVAWLSLEPADNEPVRFFSYVITALQTLSPEIGNTALAWLQSTHDVPLEVILTALTNDLAQRSMADFTLFLDDYQVISAQAVTDGMLFLLEHLPPQMHLLIATRVDPALPLARLRAQGQMVEVRATDLRLTLTETNAFLQDVMGLDLCAQAVTELERRSEGWVVGLHLAALALQDRDQEDMEDLLTAFNGNSRFVFDYFSEEVLARVPAAVHAFLLHTCILERLSAQLCNMLTSQQNGQQMLERIDQMNLFVAPLDTERRWYRYHPLFADVLRSHLLQTRPELMPELYRRASSWYEQEGLISEAVQYALEARDLARAADLLEHFDFTVVRQGQLSTVYTWFQALPEVLVRARPALCVAYASILLLNGQEHISEQYLHEGERFLDGLAAEKPQAIQGRIVTVRGYAAFMRGDIAESIAWAEAALKLLPERESHWRAGSSMLAGYLYQIDGEAMPHVARYVVDNAFAHYTVDKAVVDMVSTGQLASLQVLQGHLQHAAQTYRHLHHLAATQEELPALAGSQLAYLFGLGNVLREWNELDEAENLLWEGMQTIAETAIIDVNTIILGYGALALLLQARGNHDAAMETIDTLVHLTHQRQYAQSVTRTSLAIQAQVALAGGNLEAALAWMEASGLSCTDEVSYPCEREYLTLARVCIALGRERPAALDLADVPLLLERLLKDAEARGRISSVIEILILRAMLLQAQHHLPEALNTLQRALLLAMPENYTRIFVDEGAPMATLLRHVRTHGLLSSYVTRLLAAFLPAKESITLLADPAPAEQMTPLTEREYDVLRLLEAGASNNEIARQLVVSVNTVKKHVFNLCGKLGAQSRTQAIAKAREMKLV